MHSERKGKMENELKESKSSKKAKIEATASFLGNGGILFQERHSTNILVIKKMSQDKLLHMSCLLSCDRTS